MVVYVKRRRSNFARPRAGIDRGKTGDKTAAPDPAAAPLGTDDEAGGPPSDPEQIAQAEETSDATRAAADRRQKMAKQQQQDDRGPGSQKVELEKRLDNNAEMERKTDQPQTLESADEGGENRDPDLADAVKGGRDSDPGLGDAAEIAQRGGS